MTRGLTLALAILALVCLVWGVVSMLERPSKEGRATALGVLAVAAYAMAQFLRMVAVLFAVLALPLLGVMLLSAPAEAQAACAGLYSATRGCILAYQIQTALQGAFAILVFVGAIIGVLRTGAR